MKKKMYIVRHCQAEGQPPESPLTDLGFEQAQNLVDFFQDIDIDRIISSPFVRAIQTVEPLSKTKGIAIEVDQRLSERILSTMDLTDWLTKLQETFLDLELKFDGGESSQEAMNRIVNVIEEVVSSESENTLIVSHGNIISLLLMKYNQEFDFNCWKNLSNPDVFTLTESNNEISIQRIWRGK